MPNILVIEDDPATLYSIVDLLEAENFQVSAATDGDIALKIVEHKKIDLIVCDLLLPNLNGYEVLLSIRKDIETSNIPFIALTGKSKREDIRLGLEIGVNDYIIKPFVNRELIESIKSKLETKIFLEKCYQVDSQPIGKREDTSEENLFSKNQQKKIVLTNQLSLRDKFNKIVQKYVEEKINTSSSVKRTITSIAVCCFGLDSLTKLSYSLSQEQNHSVIQTIIQRLNRAVGDRAKILHLRSGDFALIFPYVKHLHQTLELVKIAGAALSEALIIEGIFVSITPHVGISFSPYRSEDIKNLIDRAQQALQHAKQNSEDCYEIYTPNLQSPPNYKSIELFDDLDNSLKNNELSVHYQPQVDLISGKIVGCEALLRWNHSQRGTILPATFMPIAEDSGFIEQIENWLMRTALKQLSKWHQQGHEKLKLTVNLSGSQFSSHNLTCTIINALDRVRLAPKFLAVKVSQSTLLQDTRNSMEKLSELKSFGIDVAIDNCETGYSSLGYLEQFPFSVLKVDLSHLYSSFGVKDSEVALQYIIKVAQKSNLKLIVEKIETQAQLNFLRQNKFRVGQGNFLSLPLKSNKLDLLLQGKYDRLSTLFSFPPI